MSQFLLDFMLSTENNQFFDKCVICYFHYELIFCNQINTYILFYFVNNVAFYEAFLVEAKGNELVNKIFIVNVVCMHLSTTEPS